MPADAKPAAGVKRLLFVCTGNICRSPLAEAIFVHAAREAGRAGDFEVDSAGTHDYHEGERADHGSGGQYVSHGGDRRTVLAPAAAPAGSCPGCAGPSP